MPKFTVKASTSIQAPPEKIYAVARDFAQWRPWSPWLIAEPSCRVDVDSDGRGYRWEGEIVGAGKMQVEEEEPNRSLDCRLTFLKPWKSESRVRFTFEPREGETQTTWIMEGSLPFFMFWMRSSLAAAVEQDYRRGLAMLKDYVEKGAVPSQLEFEGVQDWVGCRYVRHFLGCV